MSLIKEQVLDLQDKFDLFILNMMKNGSMDQGIGGEEQKQPVQVDGKEGQKLVSEYRKKAYMQDLGGRKRHRVELEKVEGDKSGWRDSRVHALASQIIEEKRRSSAMRKIRE